MKRKIIIAVLLIVLVISNLTIVHAGIITDNASAQGMINMIDKQNFNNTTSLSSVKNYISHFTYNSKFAALYKKVFPYPNKGSYVYTINDGTYSRNVGGAKGCYAYSKFVSMVIYGKNGDRKYHTEKARNLTGNGLKAFFMREAQAGEHIRIDGQHSVVYVSGHDNGFYCFSYNGDSNGKQIVLRYYTYSDFAKKYNNVKSNCKSSIWIYNANTNSNATTTVTPTPTKKPVVTPTPTRKPATSSSSQSSIRFELESVPKGNLRYGKSFSLKGWFRSDSAIVEARAYILDANKNIVMQSDKASSTTSNYKIQGYKLDKAMKFNKLAPGGYYLKYYVRDADGDTATWISDKFYIVK